MVCAVGGAVGQTACPFEPCACGAIGLRLELRLESLVSSGRPETYRHTRPLPQNISLTLSENGYLLLRGLPEGSRGRRHGAAASIHSGLSTRSMLLPVHSTT
jgi:hypothetical protein